MAENFPTYSLKSYGLQLEASIGRTVGMYSYYTKMNNRMGSRHTLSFVAPVFDRDSYSRWASFFTRLNISFHPFKFCPYRERIPQSDCVTEIALTSPQNSATNPVDTFSNNPLIIGTSVNVGDGDRWVYQQATLEAGEVYILSLHTSVLKGALGSTSGSRLKVVFQDGSEASSIDDTQLILIEGWQSFNVIGQTDGIHTFRYIYENATPGQFELQSITLHKLTVDLSADSRLNKEQAVNGTSGRAFDTFVGNSSTVVPGYGVAANMAITTTGTNDRSIYFPIQNLVNDDNCTGDQPWYRVSFDLTVNSGTLGTTRAAFTGNTSSALPGSAVFLESVSAGSNVLFMQSNIADYGYLAIQVFDTTAVDISIADLKVHKLGINPEVDSRTPVVTSTAVNAAGAGAFGTFSGASATGFTAAHDGTGASNKFAYIPTTLESMNPHLITFDIVRNSGSATLGHLTLYWTNSGSVDESPAVSLKSDATSISVIMIPDGNDDGLAFFIGAAFELDFTVSNFKITELPVYGTDTVPARSTLQFTGPANESSYLSAASYIQLPNDQLIITNNHLVTDQTGYTSVGSMPILRSALTTGYECKVFCPEGLFILESNTADLSTRKPGGVYDEISVTAIEHIDQ